MGRPNRPLPENPLKEYRQFVSCQTDDDVDYIFKYSGEENLVIGTDYGHNDQSTEIEALRNLKTQGSISRRDSMRRLRTIIRRSCLGCEDAFRVKGFLPIK